MKYSARFARTEPDDEFYDSAESVLKGRDDPRSASASAPMPDSDLVAELEAALMADLRSVSGLLDPAEEEPPAPRPEPPAEEDAVLDTEALGRLLASVRGPATRSEPEIPPPPPDELKPRAPKRMSRPEAPPLAPPRPARRLQSSLVVGAALVALAGGSAFFTVQSVAEHAAAQPEVASDATAPPPKVEAKAPAPVESPPMAAADPASAAPDQTGSIVRLVRMEPDPERPTLSPAPAAVADAAADLAPAPPPADPPQKLAAIDPAPPSVAPRSDQLSAGPARITAGVKLRSNPDNGAPVVGLLGAGAKVQIVGCKGWCEVVAGDKRGFVFRKFLAAASDG